MMREIKFRAWDVVEETMWYEVQDAYDTISTTVYSANREAKTLYPVSFGHLLNDKDFVVMQFTGFRDVDGKEVYEGDVVSSSNKGTHQVFWDDEGSFAVDGTYLYRMGDMKVIGNIYENPELKGKY